MTVVSCRLIGIPVFQIWNMSKHLAAMTPSEKDEHIMNVHKKNLWITAVLAVFLLAAFVLSPAAADDVTTPGSLFSIPGKTTIVSPTDSTKSGTFSLQDYGPLNIPSALLASSPSSREASLSSPAYQLATFDDVIPVRSNTVTLPITLYGQSYTIPLTRMDFESIDDGIDSYLGHVPGIADSTVIITVDKDNLFYGSITLPGDTIEIYPVQNYNYTQITPAPLHIIYSENSIPDLTSGINLCGVEENSLISSQIASQASPVRSTTDAGNWAIVGVLAVTDEEFRLIQSNWQSKAQQYIAAADYAFGRDDIRVSIGICAYDTSLSHVLSGDPRRYTNVLELLQEVYWDYFLNQRNADLVIYFGGNDVTGYKITNGTSPSGRWAWAQMVPDLSGSPSSQNTGTEHARKYATIHALGHTFGATHAHSFTYTSIPYHTVMHDSYTGPQHNTLAFSSADSRYYGDSNHDNAGNIVANKAAIENYV